MPVATNISQIRAVSDAVDTAVAAQIAAYYVPAYQPGNGEDRPDFFALSMFTKGQATHLHRTPVGGLEFDLWEGSILSVELFAPRIVDPSTEAGAAVIAGVYNRLGDMAARVDQALSPTTLAELNARLSYHKLTRLYPLADVRGFDEERKLDRHELRWRCIAGVKSDAWPATDAAYVMAPPPAAA